MRTVLAILVLLGGPVAAWEFSPTPICTLSDEGEDMSVTVTYDPVTTEYAIHLTRDVPWPEVDVFAIRFEGAMGQTISTNRHTLDAPDNQTCVDAPMNASTFWYDRACDQVRSCVRPRSCGLSSAAGLYGDMQIGSSSLTRARWRVVRNNGSPDPVS